MKINGSYGVRLGGSYNYERNLCEKCGTELKLDKSCGYQYICPKCTLKENILEWGSCVAITILALSPFICSLF